MDGTVTIHPSGTPNYTYDSGTRTFTYYFGDITTEQYIEFRTQITDKTFYMDNETRTFSNTATVTGTGIDETSDSGSQTVTSRVLEKTCTDYNY